MGFLGDVGNYIFGGRATDSIDPNLQHGRQVTTQLGKIGATVGQRQAPVIGGTQLAGDPQMQARQGLADTANRIGAVAAGTAPGAGELAVNRQIGAATAAQVAAARNVRGANAALAARAAARNIADVGIAGAAQAQQAQQLDQQSANAQLGQLYGTMRGQDIDFAGQNAQLGQQMQIANMQAHMQQQGMNDAQQIAAYGQMLGWDQARIQAEIAKAQVAVGDKGIYPSLLQAGGSAMAAASDERLKKNIADGADAADEFMDKLSPKTWEYIDDQKWGEGTHLGIIAQHLGQSKLGASALVKVDDAGHLGFDLRKASGANLAATARLHQRVKALEEAQAA